MLNGVHWFKNFQKRVIYRIICKCRFIINVMYGKKLSDFCNDESHAVIQFI